jgi:acrylyl-CoA reductase (NADPH)
MSEFQALVLREAGEGKVEGRVETLSEEALPAGEVTVAVAHSTLNYKDGMVLGGIGRLVRRYPHVPGIDFAGTVERSDSPRFKTGDQVLLTGWRVGELHWGGYAQKARVNADWLVKLPDGLTTGRAMAVGTAGFTAMLAIMALERHGVRPGEGEVLVTGAAGGVGSVAVAILHRLGHRVVAATGRQAEHGYLQDLGAASILDRAALATPPARPLDSERWAGAIDTVGGTTLATLLTQLRNRGAVAAVGNAGGVELRTTVIPFLLRGVNLLGIDSVMSPREEREEAWRRIARELPMDKLDAMTDRARLPDLPELGKRILQGGVRGRVVVDLRD